MICPKCQTEYAGDTCPHCGSVLPEKPPAEAPAPEAPASESAPELPEQQKEPIAVYIALAAAGAVILAVMSASMLIPKIILGSGMAEQNRKESSGTFSLPDDVREREESRHGREKRPKAQREESRIEPDSIEEYVFSLDQGEYRVGEDLPPGRYLLISDSYNQSGEAEGIYGDLHYAVYSTYTMTDSRRIGGGWVKNTAYIEVEDGQGLEFSFATLVEYDAFNPDPFWKSGMFIVGKDVAPGTYQVVGVDDQYSGMFWVYDGIPSDKNKVQQIDEGYLEVGDPEEVTLEEGQVLVTDFCILRK